MESPHELKEFYSMYAFIQGCYTLRFALNFSHFNPQAFPCWNPY